MLFALWEQPICISVVATSAANNMARQPEVQGRLFTVFIYLAAHSSKAPP